MNKNYLINGQVFHEKQKGVSAACESKPTTKTTSPRMTI